MEKRKILKELKYSLEVTALRNWAILYNVLILGVTGFFSLMDGIDQANTHIAAGITLALTLVPLNGYYIVRFWKIFRSPEYYKFYKAKLSQPKGGAFRDTIRFTVLLEDAEDRFVVDTHSIFRTRSFAGPLLVDYVNQIVTIAYNDLTEEVVIIG